VPYEKEIEHIGGVITDNLISSLGRGKESLMLALDLSELKKIENVEVIRIGTQTPESP